MILGRRKRHDDTEDADIEKEPSHEIAALTALDLLVYSTSLTQVSNIIQCRHSVISNLHANSIAMPDK